MADSEDTIKVAICQGLGLTQEQMLEVLGYTARQTIYNHIARDPDLHARVRSFVEVTAAKTLSLKIAAAKATETAESKIIGRLDRALSITDRALKKLEDMETDGIDTASLKELFAGHELITKWIADYAASRAPKRLKLEGEMKHTHIIADTTVDRIVAFGKKHADLLPPVIDVPLITAGDEPE